MLRFFMFISANISKQIMERLLLRKYRPHARCQPSMRPVRVGKTSKSRDDLFYTFRNGIYRLFQVKEIVDNELRCLEFNLLDKTFSADNSLNFGLVGVFRNMGKKAGERIVAKADIDGKVISSKGLLFTAPRNILAER